jgi:tetratricopeptide (TPR) repeat protein
MGGSAMIIEVLALLWGGQPQVGDLASIYQQEWERQRAAHGEGSSEAVGARRDWGLFLMGQGQYGEAIPILERAQALAPEELVGEALARGYLGLGRKAEAAAEWERLSRSADRARAARALSARGDMEENRALACGWYEKAIAKQASIARWNDLGLCAREQGRLGEAMGMFEKALALDAGRKDAETGATLNNLASALLEAGRLGEAERRQREALALLERTLGARHARSALALRNLADIVRAGGRMAEAKRLYERALVLFRARLGLDHPWTRETEEALQLLARPQGAAR